MEKKANKEGMIMIHTTKICEMKKSKNKKKNSFYIS